MARAQTTLLSSPLAPEGGQVLTVLLRACDPSAGRSDRLPVQQALPQEGGRDPLCREPTSGTSARPGEGLGQDGADIGIGTRAPRRGSGTGRRGHRHRNSAEPPRHRMWSQGTSGTSAPRRRCETRWRGDRHRHGNSAELPVDPRGSDRGEGGQQLTGHRSH